MTPLLHSDKALEPESALRKYQNTTVLWASAGSSGEVGVSGEGDDQKITVVASSPGRVIIDVDPGLGKSRMAIEIALRLFPNKKILIVCSKKALNTWRREFPKWTTCKLSEMVIIEGTPTKRKELWRQEKRVYVVTFGCGRLDYEHWKHHGFEHFIMDEVKLFRNRQTKAFKFWQPVVHKTKHAILMDGTIVSRGPQDCWTFLNMIKPKVFKSYWKYVNTFCNVIDGPFGKHISGPKNTGGLGQLMSHTWKRIRDKDPGIAEQRPPLTRDLIPINMNSQQERIYRELTDDMMSMMPSGKIVVSQSQLTMSIRHRQLLICPKILDPSLGYGTAIEDVLLQMVDDPHIVIFTPFSKALPFISQAIQEKGFPAPYILKGGTKADEVKYVEDNFNGSKGKDRATLCTVGFAESFELWSAKQGFFIGYEWTQLMNYQAEKRLHRLITPHPINIWYYCYQNSVDQAILNVLNHKQRNVNITFQDYIKIMRNLNA